MPFVFNPLSGQFDQTSAGAAQVNSDWNATSGVAQILNKPSLSAVATSGSAADLTSGTLALARLDPLVARDDLNNNFTAGQTITAAANTSALTASYSVTGANTTPLLDLSGTWNTTGIANGIRLNITDSASAATSRLMDLGVGGASRFSVTKIGNAAANSYATSSTFAAFQSEPATIRVSSGATFCWSSTSNWIGTSDLILARDAANTLAQRNGTAAQAFRLYNTSTDASNFERGFMRWNSNTLEIGTEAGGTGTNRAINFRIGTQTAIQMVSSGSGIDFYCRALFTSSIQLLTSGFINGLVGANYASGAADPTTTTLTNGNWQVYRNTTSGQVRLWANNNGTLVSVALA